VSVVAPLAAMLVAPRAMGAPANSLFFVLLIMWGAALGLFVANHKIVPRLGNGSMFVQRLVAGQLAALFGIVLSLPAWFDGDHSRTGATLVAILAQFFIFDSRGEMAPDRAERVEFGHLFGAGLCAFIVSMVFQGHWQIAVAAAAGISLVVQILSPWDPQAGARTKKLKEAIEKAEEDGDEAKVAELKAVAAAAAAPVGPVVPGVTFDVRKKSPRPRSPHAAAAANVNAYAQAHHGSGGSGGGATRYWSRPVWPFARVAWVVGIVAFLTMGVMFCVAGGTTRRAPDVGPYVAAGVSAFVFGLLSLVRTFTTTFYGWWGYLVKPLLLAACASAIASSAIVLGNLPYKLTEDDVLAGTFFIVFPALLGIVMLFIPGKWPETGAAARAGAAARQRFASTGPSPYQRRWALLLSALALAGFAGLHRIYVGKIVSGIIWLITWGFGGVGQIIDVIMILGGEFTDKRGRKLTYWEAPIGTAPPPIPAGAPDAREPRPGFVQDIERAVTETADAFTDAFKNVGGTFKATFDGMRAPSDPAHVPLPSETTMRPPRDLAVELNLRGLLSALAGLLLFVATLVALALALDVPGMLYNGVPTPDVKRELEAHAFAQFPDAWPHLLRKMSAVCIGVVMLMALTIQVFARQRGGVTHMIRGVIGAVGLIVAMLPLSEAVKTHSPWHKVGALVSHKAYNEAADMFLNSFQSAPAVGAGLIFLASVILLAWPARRAKDLPPAAWAPPVPQPPVDSSSAAPATVKGA
jgi:hypothetical protein